MYTCKSYLFHFLYFIRVGLRSWPLNANDMDTVVSQKSAKTQRNKKMMRSRSVVLPHYFLAFAFETSLCKCICTSASFHLKLMPAALFSVNLIKFNPAFYVILSTPCKMTRNAETITEQSITL